MIESTFPEYIYVENTVFNSGRKSDHRVCQYRFIGTTLLSNGLLLKSAGTQEQGSMTASNLGGLQRPYAFAYMIQSSCDNKKLSPLSSNIL